MQSVRKREEGDFEECEEPMSEKEFHDKLFLKYTCMEPFCEKITFHESGYCDSHGQNKKYFCVVCNKNLPPPFIYCEEHC